MCSMECTCAGTEAGAYSDAAYSVQWAACSLLPATGEDLAVKIR